MDESAAEEDAMNHAKSVSRDSLIEAEKINNEARVTQKSETHQDSSS